MATLAARLLTVMDLEACDEGCVTVDRLSEVTGHTVHRIGSLIHTLSSNGLVTMRSIGCYRITPEGTAYLAGTSSVRLTSGPKGPHGKSRSLDDSLRARVWRALRIRKRSCLPELMEIAGGEPSQYSNVQRYLAALERSGFVITLARRLPGQKLTSNGYKQYLMVRDSGPQAPVLRGRAMYDPNTGETVPAKDAASREVRHAG